jgi:Nuclease-related domain
MPCRTLKLRRADVCAVCGKDLQVGETGWWEPAAKTVTCSDCRELAVAGADVDDSATPDRGTAGASAGREHERRRTKRETRVRNAHPHIGGLLLWLAGEPQQQGAFKTGQLGEVAVGQSLEKRTAEGPAVILHDRRMPLGRGNIDHIAVAPTSVYVIDAKAHSGTVRIEKPLFGSTKLRIAGRDQTKLIDGLDRQVAAVRAALDGTDYANAPVQGVLCFTNADLPLLRTLTMRGHLLLYRKALAKRLNADGDLQPTAIDRIARAIATKLPPA